MANLKSTLYIYYPPDFDGELHVDFVREEAKYNPVFKFEFRYSAPKAEANEEEPKLAWKLLVRAARAIVAQEERRGGEQPPTEEKKGRRNQRRSTQEANHRSSVGEDRGVA